MGKRCSIFIIFWALCIISHSQNIQVTYHTDYARNAAKPNTIGSEQTKLVIAKGSSEFYSPFNIRIDSLRQAIERRGASLSEYQKEKSKLPEGYINFRVYKNFPKKGELTFTDRFASSDYRYTELLEKPQWKIERETKEILGYKCQKATTSFRGRTWTAWYAPDIPVQDGPWKLWGLPGLILEAKDGNSLYNFVAIGLERKDTEPISVRKKQYINCTRDEYMKQKEIYGRNPMAAIAKNAGGITIKDSKGAEVNYKDMKFEYADIEIDTRK